MLMPKPMSEVVSGMVTAASEEQPSKALSPIAVTESGIVTAASEEQP